MCRGIVVIEVAIDGILVLVALLVIGLNPVLVEEPLEEDVVSGQAGHLKRRPGLHPEAVSRRAQHVGRGNHAGGVEALAMGQHPLSRSAEMLDRQAEFVCCGRLYTALRQPDQQRLDPIIGLSAPQC